MATYREGWKDGVRYVAAMIRTVSWDPESRKRLNALTSLCIDVAPEIPPPADAEWRANGDAPSKEPPP